MADPQGKNRLQVFKNKGKDQDVSVNQSETIVLVYSNWYRASLFSYIPILQIDSLIEQGIILFMIVVVIVEVVVVEVVLYSVLCIAMAWHVYYYIPFTHTHPTMNVCV